VGPAGDVPQTTRGREILEAALSGVGADIIPFLHNFEAQVIEELPHEFYRRDGFIGSGMGPALSAVHHDFLAGAPGRGQLDLTGSAIMP
jgi:hypothetical protein